MVGRNVRVTTSMKHIANLDVDIRGRNVRVRSVNAEGRMLVELNRFIPEPQP
jgi:hypothetical protein